MWEEIGGYTHTHSAETAWEDIGIEKTYSQHMLAEIEGERMDEREKRRHRRDRKHRRDRGNKERGQLEEGEERHRKETQIRRQKQQKTPNAHRAVCTYVRVRARV